jgi:hypothetical protein
MLHGEDALCYVAGRYRYRLFVLIPLDVRYSAPSVQRSLLAPGPEVLVSTPVGFEFIMTS